MMNYTRLNNDFALKDSGLSNYEDTLNLPRHRWYYYKEGFSPLLVEKAIEEVGVSKNEIIVDPFNGSGTTTLTASLKGFKSYGIEVNPFTAFLSEAKVKSVPSKDIIGVKSSILKKAEKGATSPLIGFSTFSQTDSSKKWLFNDSVLTAFEGAWEATQEISAYNLRKLARLALISSAMQNCNAKRDGKCLRYRETWQQNEFCRDSFLDAVSNNIDMMKLDMEASVIDGKSHIIHGDARSVLATSSEANSKFKLCITSPPYLNTFDYTDIYRPELFLGKFVKSQEQLYNLRLSTVRSHIQAKWDKPTKTDFSLLYDQTIAHVNANKQSLMNKNIPLMIQAYFEDMHHVLKLLKGRAAKDAQLWLVVSNSAYANMEVPVDLIIGDIGAKAGWFLKEIGVLRYIKRRKTKHSPDVNQLRESVIIFSANK